MDKKDQIKELLGYYRNLYYAQTRAEQKMDVSFYNDTFDVPQIIAPVTLNRTGRARRMIDSPAEHIITSNPQASREVIKDTKGEADGNKRICEYLNKIVLPSMKRQNPNPFKEHVKKNLLMGEAWIQVLHNQNWVTGAQSKTGIPIIFRIPDSMIVFASPEEDANGIPVHAFLYYERTPLVVKNLYPMWTNPKNKKSGDIKETVTWWEYWDEKERFFSADDEAIFKEGFSPNPYGFVPFIHKLSGFGTQSPEGKPEELVVGRLRYSRDKLRRECAIVSSLDYTIHTFANRSLDVQPNDDLHKIPTDFADSYQMGAGLIHELPAGITVTRSVDELPEPQIFAYLQTVTSDLEKEDPMVLSGQPVGESGRLQDMTKADALMRYESIVENTEQAFSTAMSMAFKMMEKMPGLRPENIKEGDFNGNYDVRITLKAEDPLSNDRKATLGSRMLAANEIDPVRNLMDFKGYSKETSEQIMVDKMKWDVLLHNPFIAEFIGWKAIQKSGMAEELQKFIAMRQGMEKTQGVTAPPSNTEQKRGMGETSTPEGFRMIDMALSQRGQRSPPANYTRG